MQITRPDFRKIYHKLMLIRVGSLLIFFRYGCKCTTNIRNGVLRSGVFSLMMVSIVLKHVLKVESNGVVLVQVVPNGSVACYIILKKAFKNNNINFHLIVTHIKMTKCFVCNVK